jgi:gluconolactonase
MADRARKGICSAKAMTSRACALALFVVSACGSGTSRVGIGSGSTSGQASGSAEVVGTSGGSGVSSSGQASGTSAGLAGGGAMGSSAGSQAQTGSVAGSGSGAAASGVSADGGASGSGVGSGSTADAGATYKKPLCAPGPYPMPMGTNRQNVCVGFKLAYDWNEGPVWIASQQAFFFSNFALDATTNYNGDIVKYTPATGQCEIWLANAGTNGMGIAADGNLLAAVNTTQSITEFDLVTKQPKIIVDHYMGKPFNSPNDLIVHSNGTIYFTDPDYQRGNRAQELPLAVYRIDPTGALSLVETAKEPNGITLSPDEKLLYVEQDTGGGLGVYDLDMNGVPTGPSRPFAGTTDGIAVDCAGNVYLSSAGGIFSPAGMSLGMIPGGGGTHPTFGGSDGMTLLVVGNGSDLTLATQVSTVQYNLPGIQ